MDREVKTAIDRAAESSAFHSTLHLKSVRKKERKKEKDWLERTMITRMMYKKERSKWRVEWKTEEKSAALSLLLDPYKWKILWSRVNNEEGREYRGEYRLQRQTHPCLISHTCSFYGCRTISSWESWEKRCKMIMIIEDAFRGTRGTSEKSLVVSVSFSVHEWFVDFESSFLVC